MDYWLVMLNEENYLVCEEKRLYGTPRDYTKLVKPGDKLVVYVLKEGCRELCQSFAAVWEVAGRWRESAGPTWPDEVEEGRVKYPWVVEVKPVAAGRLPIGEVAPLLAKYGIDGPQKLRLYSLYYRRAPLPPELGRAIEERLSASVPPSQHAAAGGRLSVGGRRRGVGRVHDAVSEMLVEVGGLLGFYGEREVENSPFRHDVVWWRSERERRLPPVAVFEVVVGGEVERSLAALKHAYDVWRCALFLVFADERKRERAEKLVEPYLSGAFHEIAGHLHVMSVEDVEEMYRDLKRHERWLKLFAKLRR